MIILIQFATFWFKLLDYAALQDINAAALGSDSNREAMELCCAYSLLGPGSNTDCDSRVEEKNRTTFWITQINQRKLCLYAGICLFPGFVSVCLHC